MSEGVYWCLMVPMGVCGYLLASECLLASEGAHWCLLVSEGD